MAKLVTETMIVRFSRIVRSDDETTTALTDEARETLQSSLKEIYNEDSALIVEVETDQDKADPRQPSTPRPERRLRRGETATSADTPAGTTVVVDTPEK
jgi:hypothetical protein